MNPLSGCTPGLPFPYCAPLPKGARHRTIIVHLGPQGPKLATAYDISFPEAIRVFRFKAEFANRDLSSPCIHGIADPPVLLPGACVPFIRVRKLRLLGVHGDIV